MKKSILWVLCVLSFSCHNDTTSGKLKKPEGMWLLSEAKRDGKPTKTLKGLFLDFGDSVITSNFTGDTLTAAFTFDKDLQAIQYYMHDTFNYQIKNLTDSLLEMKAEIRGMPFEFIFVRKDSL
jgi:hypothetical protein